MRMEENGVGDGAVRAFRVRGRVQGVGFRWWTRRTAEDLAVAGSVRNCPDGTVEVRAAGDPDALERLYEALERGPASARVEAIEEMPAHPDTPREGFHIRR